MSETILYEHPVNELLRVCLRLEYLLQQTEHYIAQADYFASRTALANLIDIINVLDRPDLRSKLTTELLRYKEIIQRLSSKNETEIDNKKLEQLITGLSTHISHLENNYGRLGQELRDDEFLSAVRYALGRPGGAWNFDLPLYHHWLQQAPKKRSADLSRWFNTFTEIKTILAALLHVVRDWAASPTIIQVENGFYQMVLDPKLPYQLLQLWVPLEADVIPEISFGKHRLTIRLLDVDYAQRPQQTTKNIDCEMKLCVL